MKPLSLLLIPAVSCAIAAQEAPVAPSQPAAAQPAGETLIVHNGEPLLLQAKAPFSSKTLHAGDTVRFEVVTPVTADGLVVIATGASATAQVADAEPAGRVGKGGKLGLVFDSVDMVTGRTASIRATTSESAGGTRAMVANMVSAGLLSSGLAAPFFLLQHGHEVEYRRGERFLVMMNGDVTVNRAEVAAHQPQPPPPRTDVAILYVIKRPIKGEFLSVGGKELTWLFTIGETGWQLSPDSALRFELPPGKYWLHAFGRLPLKRNNPGDLVSVEAKGGESYYLQFALGNRKYVLQPVAPETAKEMLNEVAVSVPIPPDEIPAEKMKRMLVQPAGQ